MRLAWPEVEAALAGRPSRQVVGVGRRAAVALVLRDGPNGTELLFIRRAEDPRDPWSGQIAFPGGRAEPQDSGLKETAIRETLEETHVDLARDGHLLGTLDEVRAMARTQPLDLGISPFVFGLEARAEAVAGHEVGSVHWALLEALLSEDARSTVRYMPLGGDQEFPCLRVDGLVIWGLTYRMFFNLAERLGVQRAGGGAPE